MQQTLLIADDHPLIRSGMRAQLEHLGRFRIVEAWDQQSLHKAVRDEKNIDLALLDLVMPGAGGPQWLLEFCEAHPELPIMVVTAQNLARHAVSLARFPNVRGLVAKTQSATDLRSVVDLALAGVRVWPQVNALPQRRLAEADSGGFGDSGGDEPSTGADAAPGKEKAAIALLGGRQREVALLIAQGLTNREVALRLGLTEGTVKNYVKEIFRTVGVSNRTQLALCFGSAG